MEIPMTAIREYAESLSSLCELADAIVAGLIEERARELADSGTAGEELADALVAFALQTMTDILGMSAPAAAAVSAALFDEVMASEGSAAKSAPTGAAYDEAAVERAARYQAYRRPAGELIPSDYARACGSAAGYHTRKAANDEAIRSVEAANRVDGRIRYARVPTGAETCTYCLMLASRGFAYTSEQSAGHADHRGCDCLIVPGLAGSTTVEGYDLQQMRDLWRDYEEIDDVAFTGGDGQPLRGRALREARAEAKRDAMAERIGRTRWSDAPGEVRKTSPNK